MQETLSNIGQYQLHIYVGDGDMPSTTAPVLNVTPKEVTPAAVTAVISASSLTAADLRTPTLFVVGPGSAERALMVYAAVCGFAGRFLDISDMSEVLETRPLNESLRLSPSPAPRTLDTPPVLTGPGVGRSFLDDIMVDDALDLHFTKKAFFLPDESVLGSLYSFVAVASLRWRNKADRFPLLYTGVVSQDVSEMEAAAIDLDLLRRTGAETRRSRRIDDRGAVVDPTPSTTRQQTLLAAAQTPLEATLLALGSHQDTETDFWRCPRPERHRNGDANPSSRITEHGFRCFRCDTEQVDALRLVMDTKGLSPDDAAVWLASI
jgi:hypothetical protein